LQTDGQQPTLGSSFTPWSRFALPFKYHAEHRHHIPKPRYRVTNWAEYDASLKRRGSPTVWFTDEAIQAWRAEPRTTPGGQPHYSAVAITTALTMRMVFGLGACRTRDFQPSDFAGAGHPAVDGWKIGLVWLQR
jgi:hypothetical protein